MREAIDCCSAIIQDMGFQEDNETGVWTSLADKHRISVILMPGCQNKQMLNDRVTAGAQFITQFSHNNFEIVFSGRNPSPDGT